jgi:hypothetical protein
LSKLRRELCDSPLSSIEDWQFQLPRRTRHALAIRFFFGINAEGNTSDIAIRLGNPEASHERTDFSFRRREVKALIDC